MKKELKQKWITALRDNDKYKQTKEALFDQNINAYCCLGVLCEVMGLHKDARGAFYPEGSEWDESGGFIVSLPSSVLKKINLKTEELNIANTEAILIEMNDETNKDFAEIADWIEENIVEE
jgi:hypothetical protein